jgi:alpha-glucosidase
MRFAVREAPARSLFDRWRARLPRCAAGSHSGMGRSLLRTIGVALALVAPATASAQQPSLPDVPVASCPSDEPAVALRVSPAAVGSWLLGPFAARLTADGLRVRADGHDLWSSARGGFVAAGAGDPGILDGGGGFYGVDAGFSECWRRQSVTSAVRRGGALVLGGRVTGRRGSIGYTATLAPASPLRLRLTVRLQGDAADAVVLAGASSPGESVHGFGAQTRWNLKGATVPVLSREQGVGRGDPGITEAQNALRPPQGGDESATYAVVPQYVTSRDRGLFLTDTEYSAFDLRSARAIRTQLWSRTLHAQILRGNSPAALIRAYTQYAGRMRPMPAWVDRGAIVGIQGGTDVVRQRVAQLQAAGVPLAGVWLQDWVGQRVTSFGSRLLWNWTLNTARYAGWEQMVADLRKQGIRVMTYINPMLADAAGIPGPQRNLYAEALARGYVIHTAAGDPYIVDQGGFNAALIDLTSPAARAWTRGVLRDMAVKFGASGWMADFAEQTPFAGRFANGASGGIEHNRFPDRWSRIQASALAGLPDVVDFHRAAFSTSPRSARLFWMGDQTVNWSRRDGMESALTGMLSGGMSGFALNHSDTGGYTTLVEPPVQRTPELLERWSEMNAFGGAMFRTHEGNRPQLNVQPYSSPEIAAAFARWARVFRALAPYRQRLERAAHRTGIPIVRPLWLSDRRLGGVTDAFTLGRAVLVAPAFAPDVTRTSVSLPAGRWTHVWTGRAFRGGRSVTVAAPVGQPAVFVRARSGLAALIRAAATG